MKLENIISNLKKVKKETKKIKQSDLLTLFGNECFTWKGEMETLGKIEKFAFENLFITSTC